MAKYSGADIQTHGIDVDKCRARPTQYMGAKGSPMFMQMVAEPFDNAVDEHLAKRNNLVHIVFDPKTNQVAVLDEGYGIPTEKVNLELADGRTIKMSALTAIFTQLQAGGKFSDKAYKVSGGVHGVGVTATNALSTQLKVWSTYNGKVVSQTFAKGRPQTEVVADKLPVFGSGKQAVKMRRIGSAVAFTPDFSIIGKGSKLDIQELLKKAELRAYLNPKLTIKITVVGKGTKVFKRPDGLAGFIKNEIERRKASGVGKPCVVNTDAFDFAFQFTDYDNDDAFFAYTNSLPNRDGGVHVDLVRQCLHAVLTKLAGARAKPFKERDLRDGLIGMVDWRLHGAEFSSQTKEKLVDIRVKEAKPQVMEAIEAFFNANKSLAKDIIARAGELAALKNQQLTDRRALKALKTKRGSSGLPSKLSKASGKFKANEIEIYLVEGDSAGGTAKKARYPYQEILPVKGKVLNVFKAKEGAAFESSANRKGEETNEVLQVLRSIGYDPNLADPYSKLRVGKIVLFSDPDPDGYHINALQLGLLTKYLRPLFDKGLVYIALTYEYYARTKTGTVFGNSKEEVAKKAPGVKDIRHIKGWGEVNPQLLREMAFDPKLRQLVQLSPVSKSSFNQFVNIMGEDVSTRKQLLNIKD